MWREVGGRAVGADAPVFTIAEIGLNHGGSLDRALQMVDAAAWAGASAVKLQAIVADRLVAASCPPPAHVAVASLREFFAQFELDLEAHRAIVGRARAHGLAAIATVFAEETIAALEALDLDAYKIASGDLTYDGLVVAAARTGRPLLLSTGMSHMAEVAHAVSIADGAGADRLALLHCVSAYPTPAASENLRAIPTLAFATGLPVGLSDHGSGLLSAVAAVALGACLYERHLVLDGDDDAVDRAVSSTPSELKAIVQAMEQTRLALGTGRKECQPAEAVNLRSSRRGLYGARPLRAGECISRADVAVLRPASLLGPSDLEALIGTRLGRDLSAGDPFVPSDIPQETAA